MTYHKFCLGLVGIFGLSAQVGLIVRVKDATIRRREVTVGEGVVEDTG